MHNKYRDGFNLVQIQHNGRIFGSNFEIEIFAELLKLDKKLELLKLRGDCVNDNVAEILAEWLKEGELNKLILHDNKIGKSGFEKLFEALNINKTLKELYLDVNDISEIWKLSKMLEISDTLEVLYLMNFCDDDLGDIEVEKFAEALKINKTLKELYLENYNDRGLTNFENFSGINYIVAEQFAEALKINNTIISLSFDVSYPTRQQLQYNELIWTPSKHRRLIRDISPYRWPSEENKNSKMNAFGYCLVMTYEGLPIELRLLLFEYIWIWINE